MGRFIVFRRGPCLTKVSGPLLPSSTIHRCVRDAQAARSRTLPGLSPSKAQRSLCRRQTTRLTCRARDHWQHGSGRGPTETKAIYTGHTPRPTRVSDMAQPSRSPDPPKRYTVAPQRTPLACTPTTADANRPPPPHKLAVLERPPLTAIRLFPNFAPC